MPNGHNLGDYPFRVRDLIARIENLIGETEEEEEEEPPCGRVKVIFEQIDISDSQNDGWFGEPGPRAEWRVDLHVKNRSERWSSDQVKDNTQFRIGKSIVADLDGPKDTIRVWANGHEEDSSSANDTLPQGESSSSPHGRKDNWGINQYFTLRGSNSTFSYTIDYRIECLHSRTSALSLTRAKDAVRARLESSDVDVSNISEDKLMTIFLDRARREGLEVKSQGDGMMTFEGPLAAEKVLEDFFPENGDN